MGPLVFKNSKFTGRNATKTWNHSLNNLYYIWCFKSVLQSEDFLMWCHPLCFFKAIFLTTLQRKLTYSFPLVCLVLWPALQNSCVLFRYANRADISGACYHVVGRSLGWRLWPASCHPWSDKLLDNGSCHSSSDNGLFLCVLLSVLCRVHSDQWKLPRGRVEYHVSGMLWIWPNRVRLPRTERKGGLHHSLLQEWGERVWLLFNPPRYVCGYAVFTPNLWPRHHGRCWAGQWWTSTSHWGVGLSCISLLRSFLPLSWQQRDTWQGSPKAGSITGQKTPTLSTSSAVLRMSWAALEAARGWHYSWLHTRSAVVVLLVYLHPQSKKGERRKKKSERWEEERAGGARTSLEVIRII